LPTNGDARHYRAERQEEKRKHTAIRMDGTELDELDEFARSVGLVNKNGKPVRSAALRLRNRYARDHMPTDYARDHHA
jgi:hypothetical protein